MNIGIYAGITKVYVYERAPSLAHGNALIVQVVQDKGNKKCVRKRFWKQLSHSSGFRVNLACDLSLGLQIRDVLSCRTPLKSSTFDTEH